MNDADISEIRKLFFKRVTDPASRDKIHKLAYVLSDEQRNATYWRAIYYYSLFENRKELERDFNEFVVGYVFGEKSDSKKKSKERRAKSNEVEK